jgi:hypothetical protein
MTELAGFAPERRCRLVKDASSSVGIVSMELRLTALQAERLQNCLEQAEEMALQVFIAQTGAWFKSAVSR